MLREREFEDGESDEERILTERENIKEGEDVDEERFDRGRLKEEGGMFEKGTFSRREENVNEGGDLDGGGVLMERERVEGEGGGVLICEVSYISLL